MIGTVFRSEDVPAADRFDSWRELIARTRSNDLFVRGMGLDIPKALLPLPPHRVRELLNRRLSGHEGIGALLSDHLTGQHRQADTLHHTHFPNSPAQESA